MSNTFYPDNDYRAYLSHGGPGSGRYPRGSGKNPFQHVKDAARSAKAKAGPWFEPTVKGGKDKPNKSPAEVTVEQTGRIIGNTADIVKTVKEVNSGRKQSGAKEMSDAELQRALQRLRLEAEYDRLTTANTRDGYDAAMSVLTVAGSLVAIVGGTLKIISTVKGMG